MATTVPNDFEVSVPVLPPGVVPCEGIPRTSWFTKCVTLQYEAGFEVEKEICHSVDAELIIDMEGKPLGDDWVAIQIAESLYESEVPFAWMWSLHSWPISRVYLNGANLYDHDQTSIFRAAANASRRRVRVGVRPYESSRERQEPSTPPKKESLLTSQEIAKVSSKICYAKNCLQPFPHGQIQAIWSQIHVEGGVY